MVEQLILLKPWFNHPGSCTYSPYTTIGKNDVQIQTLQLQLLMLNFQCWYHIAIHHHWKRRCPITNRIASVAHVKCSMVMLYRPTASLERSWSIPNTIAFSCICRDTPMMTHSKQVSTTRPKVPTTWFAEFPQHVQQFPQQRLAEFPQHVRKFPQHEIM